MVSTFPAVTASISDIPYTVSLMDGVHRWLGDESELDGGANAGPTPFHLLLSSLGACTAITLSMYAKRKAWPLTGVDINLEYNPNGKPADGNQIVRHVVLRGELNEEQRERLLQVANACPIHKVLSGKIEIDTELAV
ncbi:MAG: OsmC family protein [Candidatus Saccharibacteria bacterium]|nr:OsmC family protein [Moraxellaceae bacterium]